MIDLNTILTPGTTIDVAPGTHTPLPVQLTGTLTVTKINIADGIKQTITYTDSSVYYRDIFPARGVVGEWVCDSFGAIQDWKDLNLVPTQYSTRWPTFSEVTEKPSTIAGYGITDAYKRTGGEITGTVSIINGQNLNLTQSESTSTYNSINFFDKTGTLKSKIQYTDAGLDISSTVSVHDLISNRHVIYHNGSTVYSNSGLEVRSTDGSDVRIGFHRSGHSAGAINHNSWGFQFEREAGGGSRANVAAANFFADAAQDMTGNALTRKDYVDGVLSSKFDKSGGTISGDITINTYSIRGVNGAAIVKDHGNGNTTFSGSRNASSAAGDLYLGYHDNANHFTNKIILCRSMYSDANQNLQIVDYSNGALFDRGAAVIGANRDNVLNNPSFGVGFLSAADSGAQWIASYFGKNGGSNQVVVGELAGGAVIGGHNAAKNAWAPIAINPGASGTETTYIGMYANQSTGSGNLFVGNDVEANYMRLRSDIPNDSRYVVNRGYVDGNFIKRRTRLHPDDGTSLDNVQQEHGFNYSTGGGIFGPYISFGGLYGSYECQINADFISGNDIKFRTHNGDAGRWNPWRTLWNSGNFDPGTKLDNGGYGDTLHLSNWIRTSGATGWYNETYGGGVYMTDASWVRVSHDKRFFVSNTSSDAISTDGGFHSRYVATVLGNRWLSENGGSYEQNRYTGSPIDVPFLDGVPANNFAPFISSYAVTQGNGYTTRVKLGMLTSSGDWAKANLFVGGAEGGANPMANYTFDIHGNVAGINKLNAGYLYTERSDASVTLELKNNVNDPGLAFHRPTRTWAELRHDGTRYYMNGDGQNFTIGNDMVCSYAYANGAQPQVANALTRKDYVDTQCFNSRWDNRQVPNHTSGDANAHYNSEWDGNGVANAPSADWFFFRDIYHSNGGNWRHQEAFNFYTDEEYFRRGTGASDYAGWVRRWNSSNFNPASKSDVGHTHSYMEDGGTYGTLNLNNWIRTNGATGWYSSTYGGGIYMEDVNYIRTYGGKRFYVNNTAVDAISTAGGIIAGARIVGVGAGNDYNTAALEVRGNGSSNVVFPGVGFHQPGVFAGSLQMRNSTDFLFYQQGAGAYADVYARSFVGGLSGNASTATKLASARTIAIGSTSALFDGSSNIAFSLADMGAVPTSSASTAVAANYTTTGTNTPSVGSIAQVVRYTGTYTAVPELAYGATTAGSVLRVGSTMTAYATQSCTGTWKMLSFMPAVSSTGSVTVQNGIAVRIA